MVLYKACSTPWRGKVRRKQSDRILHLWQLGHWLRNLQGTLECINKPTQYQEANPLRKILSLKFSGIRPKFTRTPGFIT
jgi:hypothetical protein